VFAIVDLIGSSSGQIRSCVSSVSEVGVALGTIIEEVREISWHVTAAIVAAQEQ
jgi:methyl-accepting chemotaxis protein